MQRQGSHKLNTIMRTLGGKTEHFKRPNHPDFLTTEELKKIEFSGVRQNEITREWEFWLVGEIKAVLSEAAVQADNSLLAKTHVEIFHMRDERFGGFIKTVGIGD